MTQTPLTHVVCGPDALPALLPHLLGFHPAESLVLIGLGADRRTVRVTMRADLPEPGGSGDPFDHRCARSLDAFARAGAEHALLVVVPPAAEDPWRGPVPHDLPRREVVAAAEQALCEIGVGLADAVCVVGDRLRSYLCADPTCCPPEGRCAPPDESLRVRAAFVEQGSAPLDSRADLVATLAPRASDDAFRQKVDRGRDRALTRMPADLVDRVCSFLDDVESWGSDPRGTTSLTRLVATADVLCSSIRSRDLLLHQATTGQYHSLLPHLRQVLAEAVRCGDGPGVAPAAASLAVLAWVAGDGAAAWVAVDRGLAADPGYSLALLVAEMLEAGFPPWTWIEMMSEVSVAEILGADRPGPARSPG